MSNWWDEGYMSAQKWWDEGYMSAQKRFCKTYTLSGKKKPKLFYDGTIV